MIKNLVIAGGGLKTAPVIGAIKYLEEKNIIENVTSYYGASAGSIFCLLLILKYSAIEIENLFLNLNMGKLFEPNTDIENFFNYYCIYNQNKFAKIIKLLINYKLGRDLSGNICGTYENITMYQLYIKTGIKFTCSVVSLKTRTVKYFNHISQPNIPVFKLLMMTSAVPFIFKPVKWRDVLYVDGGMVDNFPIHIIPANEIEYTLGIRPLIKLSHCKTKINTLYDYVNCIFSIVTCSINKINSFKVIWIEIDEKNTNDVLNTSMNKENKLKIIQKGYDDMKKQYTEFKKVKYINASTQTDMIIKYDMLKRSKSL
jgi:patatin-like phospholipase/acyl hydrolase